MKNKKKIKVPAYAFGTELISNMLKALPEATTLIASPFLLSTATSGGEAFALSVAGIGLGINAGMEIGKNFGAAGALVGGAIGAGVGLIGKGGREASMSSFTELDEGTLGTGLTGMFKNRRLRRKRNRLRQIAANNRDAVRGTNYLQNEYGEDYGDMDVNTFADGGYTSSLAYVDDGELIQTPDGTISKVPENNKPTDSNLIDLPEGSRILSDKLKVPGKKETFAQLGEKMMAKNKSKYNDAYALNAAKLNEINNNIIHDLLFAMLEEVKRRKGIKPKYKGILSFDDGGVSDPKYLDKLTATHEEVLKPKLNTTSTTLSEVPQPTYKERYTDALDKTHRNYLTRIRTEKDEERSKITNATSHAATGIASLAPIMSNLFTGKPESVDAVYNPYATAITNTMRRRRFNIDPAILDINRNRAISNYNMRQMNTSTGANLAYSLQSAINTDKVIANLRSMESNANDQYLGEYANTMNNLGQQWVGATNLAAEANAQNRATNRNIRRAGISQLSQWAQNRELMRNQEARDNAMLAMYGPFLQAGYTANTIKEFNRWLNKGGNYVG